MKKLNLSFKGVTKKSSVLFALIILLSVCSLQAQNVQPTQDIQELRGNLPNIEKALRDDIDVLDAIECTERMGQRAEFDCFNTSYRNQRDLFKYSASKLKEFKQVCYVYFISLSRGHEYANRCFTELPQH